MEQRTVRRRIEWVEAEHDAVATRIVELIIEHPEYTGTTLLEEGQHVLPEERRRNIQGFAVAKRVHELVKTKLAALKNGSFKATTDETAARSLEQMTQAKAELEARLADAQQQLEAIRNQPKPEPVDPAMLIATAPTEQLLSVLFMRAVGSISGERMKMEAGLQELITKKLEGIGNQLANERQQLERRMYNIETGIASGHLKSAPVAPSVVGTKDENVYMPVFLFAGLQRADFQRLQSALMNTGLRLRNLDISKPSNISIPEHDRVILCPGLPESIAATIMGRTKKHVRHTGAIDKIGPLVLDEAQKVRTEKK